MENNNQTDKQIIKDNIFFICILISFQSLKIKLKLEPTFLLFKKVKGGEYHFRGYYIIILNSIQLIIKLVNAQIRIQSHNEKF